MGGCLCVQLSWHVYTCGKGVTPRLQPGPYSPLQLAIACWLWPVWLLHWLWAAACSCTHILEPCRHAYLTGSSTGW